MIIYEVNLTINNEIYDDYYAWLLKHVEHMLTFDGFKKAEIGTVTDNEAGNNNKKLCVSYTLQSNQDLENYFRFHATNMRAEAIEKFGNSFSATRRVITNSVTFERF